MFNKNKIAVIVPYFGEFNNYFQLWLNSCRYNDKIDWILFTDDKQRFDYPSNVTVYYKKFHEIVELIQSIYSFKISLNNPYKLCDYKVAYGEIFREYLIGYEFWGYCDTDLIFGNINRFVTEFHLKKYNKLFIGGHFSLYRNIEEVNSFYRQFHGPSFYNYTNVFTSDDSFAYDEYSNGKGIGAIYSNREDFFNEVVFSDILFNKSSFHNSIEIYGTKEKRIIEKNKKYKIFHFNKGILNEVSLRNGEISYEEKIYIHLQKRDMKNEVSKKFIDNYLIVPNKFIDKEEITARNIGKIGKGKMLYYSYYKVRAKNILRKVSKKYII